MLAIDHAVTFDLALPAMEDLTNGNAVFLGRVPVDAVQVPNSRCGM